MYYKASFDRKLVVLTPQSYQSYRWEWALGWGKMWGSGWNTVPLFFSYPQLILVGWGVGSDTEYLWNWSMSLRILPKFRRSTKKGKDNDETHGKHIGLHSSTPRPHRPTPGAETHTFKTYTFRVFNVEIPAIPHTYRNTDVCKKLLLHNVAVWRFFADILPTS